MAVDGFYPDPDRVRAKALGMEYTEPEHLVGWRTKPFFPHGVKARIEKLLRARITSRRDAKTKAAPPEGGLHQFFAWIHLWMVTSSG
jgi:hypothetical protein